MNIQKYQQAVMQYFCVIFLFLSQSYAKSLDAEEEENLNAVKKLHRVKRIINGWDIEAGQWPWLVHLRGERETGSWWSRKTIKYYCGGSIVSDRYVLTAAHCFKQGGDNQLMDSKAWHVTHGDNEWDLRTCPRQSDPVKKCTNYHTNAPEWLRLQPEVGQSQKVPKEETKQPGTAIVSADASAGVAAVTAKNAPQCSGVWEGIKHFWCRLTSQSGCRCHLHNDMIFIHPNYNARDYWNNDIALMKVEDSLLDKDNTAIVNLPRAADVRGVDWPAAGSQCICKGWGCTSDGGPVVEFAKAVGLASYDNVQCAAFYTSRSNPIDIQNRMCAFKSGNGICSGDSGGPLVCKDRNDRWVQAGIVSFAAADAPEMSPAVFARVSTYMDWIDLVVNNF